LLSQAQESIGQEFGVRSLQVGEVLLKKVMLLLARVKALTASIKFNQEQSEIQKKNQKLLIIKDNRDILGNGDSKKAEDKLQKQNGAVEEDEDRKRVIAADDGDEKQNIINEDYAIAQDKELKSQLLAFIQEILEDAFDIFQHVNQESNGTATIEVSGVSVKQLMKKCCLLGINSGKEDDKNQVVISKWEKRK
jgi:hypothetical protein